MTSAAGGEPPERPYALQLDATGLGTVLGSLAWVLGALEIMRDRGHAEGSEELHDLLEGLAPRLEALLADLAQARSAVERESDSEPGLRVEESYTHVREAFERWIQLTAADTTSVAIGQRLAELAELADDAESGEDG